MHDLNDLDRRGLPGVNIVTEPFRDGAAVQSDALGLEPAIVWLPHPIQNRSTEELHRLADDTVERILSLLKAG